MSPKELLNKIHIHEDEFCAILMQPELENINGLSDSDKDLYDVLCACEDYVKLAVPTYPLDAEIVNEYLFGVCPSCLQPYTQHLNELSYLVGWHCPVCGQAIDKHIVEVIAIEKAFEEE